MLSNCPICDSRSEKKPYSVKEMYYGTREEFDYAQCPDCGVLYLNQRLEDMKQFYPENYHGHTAALPGPSRFGRWTRLRDRAVLTGKPFFGKFLCFYKSPHPLLGTLGKAKLGLDSKVLDIGCGAGNLLHQLRTVGFKRLAGVDPFLPEALAVHENGFVIEKKSVGDVKGPFDFVMLNHSLEHMPEHKKVLSEIRSLLSPEGICMIRVPVIGGLAWKTYQDHWYQLDAPRHLIIHSEESFKRLALTTGFRIVQMFFDSEETQFIRSELYLKNISMKEFFDVYQGDADRLFSHQQLAQWRKMTEDANRSRSGDQAVFFLRSAISNG